MGLSAGQQLWQFRLLMWKHFLVQRRLAGKNFVLIILPAFPAIFFALFRLLLGPVNQCFQSCQDNNAYQSVTQFNVVNNSKILAFYPDSPLTRRVMETASCLSAGQRVNYSSLGPLTGFHGEPLLIEGFADERLMVELITTFGKNYLGAVTFQDVTNVSTVLEPSLNYTIRLPEVASDARRASRYSWRTDRIYPVLQLPGIFRFINYVTSFVPLQHILDQAIIRLQVEGNSTCPLVTSCPDAMAADASTTCTVTGRTADGDNGTAFCSFNSTTGNSIQCQNSSSALFDCNCARNFSTNTTSRYGLYSANCTCAAGNTVSKVTCISVARSSTSCCGRCQGSANQTTFVPTMFKTFPFPNYSLDTLLILFTSLYGLVLLICYIAVVISIVLELVTEKSSRLRESMRMMGLRMWIYWATHFLKSFLILLPAAILSEVILRPILFPDTDQGIIFVWYLFLNVQTVCFSFFLSSLIDSPKAVSTAAGVLWYLTSVPFNIAGPNFATATRPVKRLMCLFPMSAAAIFSSFTGNKKTNGEALTLASLSQPTSVDDDFRFNDILLAQFLSSVLCMAVLWYKENAFPGEFGVPRVWYFPFTRSYWFGAPPADDEEQRLLSDKADPDKNEADPTGLKVGISIRSLQKVFKTNDGDKVAVDNMSLNMYNDQITVLLGHNGAGKTTTMSMLVGLFPPTHGDALIGGHSIVSDIEGVRKSIGLCPQHNVLFSTLSVQEHLSFFYQLKKGHGGGDADCVEMMGDLQLLDKTNWKSSDLSGGMKRKLSVGVALIGRPKVVILDEPTAGMDPYARRATWDLMSKYKPGCTMLLTTHLMDEADLLGDRIAIMSKGAVVCSGSSLYLKKKYGVGYHMVLVKDHERDCNEETVTHRVLSMVPGSRLVGNAGAELAYVLPNESTAHFSELFTSLERDQKELGILSYGVSVTKLEEVFLKVGEDEGIVTNKKLQKYEMQQKEHAALGTSASAVSSVLEDGSPPAARELGIAGETITEGEEATTAQVEVGERKDVPPVSTTSNGTTATTATDFGDGRRESSAPQPERERRPLEMLGVKYTPLTGRALWLHQFKAMLLKRFYNAKRSHAHNALTVLVPVVFASFSFASLVSSPAASSDPTLHFNYTSLRPQATFIADYRSPSEQRQMPLVHSNATRDYLVRTTTSRILDHGPSSLRLRGGERDCCAAKDFLLNSTCIRKRYAEGEEGFKSCPSSFGFKECTKCLKNEDTFERFVGKCGFGCPAVPLLTTAKRDSILFQKRLLQDANVGLFYIQNPAGFTMHSVAVNPDDLPDSLPDTTYFETNVSCSDPTVPQLNSTCKDWVPRPEYFTSNFDAEGTGVYARVWASAKSYHAYPIAMNAFSNIHLKSLMESQSKRHQDYFIQTANFPLPPSVEEQLSQAGSSISAFVFVTLVAMGMGILSASFVVSPVEEVGNKAKHIQKLCGVKSSAYWLANFAWDYLFFMAPVAALIIVFAAFNVEAYRGDGLGAVIVLLLLFGWSAIPFAYWLSFAFSGPAKAFKNAALFFGAVPIVFLVANFVLQFPGIDLPKIADALRYIFFLFPHFCFAQGLGDLYTINEQKGLCNGFPEVAVGRGISRAQCFTRFNIKTNLFDIEQPGVGIECLYMFFTAFFFAAMVHVAESGFWKELAARFRKRSESQGKPSMRDAEAEPNSTVKEDADVARERANVTDNLDAIVKKEAVVLHNLTKTYNSFLGRPAADRLCLTVPHGECFGLCGVNGAGKTTTFNMMTGDVPASSGTVYLQGYDIATNLTEVQRNIGYCPQFDALLERLTSRELLRLYCHLRGIPEEHITPTVESIISEMHLTDWADKTCGTYSGGNKRKLSVAVALVGNPPILFLDEPTAGMDPGARRFLWDVLTDVMATGRSIVLTSHSMEECEALCTRLAIMVNGRFKCLGSIQHLKNKFGSGYSMSLKVANMRKKQSDGEVGAADTVVYTGEGGDDDDGGVVVVGTSAMESDVDVDEYELDPLALGAPSTEEAEAFIKETFPGSELLESRQGQLHYNINIPGLTWSTLFREVEGQRKRLNVVDYSVTQATLEEVFVNFASAQFDDAEKAEADSKKKKKKNCFGK